MRVGTLTAVLVLALVTPGSGAGRTRARRAAKAAAVRVEKAVTVAEKAATGMFTDVPVGHWAYAAVEKVAQAGLLQGSDGKFHGRQPVSRYQLALFVARLLDQIGKGGIGKLAADDLESVEALLKEFSDELAYLNIRTQKLEEYSAETRRELDHLKADVHGAPGARRPVSAGVHGLVAVRAVSTDSNGPASAPHLSGLPYLNTLYFPFTRYSGAVLGNGTFSSRFFFTIPQVSLSVDRCLDEGVGLHLQLDFDGDSVAHQNNGAGLPLPSALAGIGTQVNEAFIDMEHVLPAIGMRVGGFAVPFSCEHNGPQRTLDYTITPSAASWRVESLRPIGIEFRVEPEFCPWDVRLGVFTGLDGPALTGTTVGVTSAMANIAGGTDVSGALFLPAVFGNAPYTDAPSGLRALQPLSQTGGVGAYLRVADQPDEGFGWDLNYLMNGGKIADPTRQKGTASEFSLGVATLRYAWCWFDVIVQYYQGTTKTASAVGSVQDPFTGVTTTSTATDPIDSSLAYILFNYRWYPESTLSLRYESGQDEVKSLGKIQVSAMTAAWNRLITDHSLFQLEYIQPTGKITVPSGAQVFADQKNSMIQANFKYKF
ncbi:MAG: S-layer homology domain-containing protein [Candidatus Riflebacteria bacterium]|nr:S-layer homology domain-containing protein [Candidatus Riflebacteria bacterium]